MERNVRGSVQLELHGAAVLGLCHKRLDRLGQAAVRKLGFNREHALDVSG